MSYSVICRMRRRGEVVSSRADQPLSLPLSAALRRSPSRFIPPQRTLPDERARARSPQRPTGAGAAAGAAAALGARGRQRAVPPPPAISSPSEGAPTARWPGARTASLLPPPIHCWVGLVAELVGCVSLLLLLLLRGERKEGRAGSEVSLGGKKDKEKKIKIGEGKRKKKRKA